MTTQRQRCPSCGGAATGRFCSACGTALTPGSCAACGAPRNAQARFCPSCGADASADAGAPRRRPTAALVAAGGAVLALAIAIVLIARSQPRAAATETGDVVVVPAGTPPDISKMSPRERFDRLYDRSMRASESGDTVTVAQFAPMALLAYQQLDTIDADARYHAALLRLHTGDIPGAAALGDSIVAMTPGHLLGYVVQVTVARWRHDAPALSRAYADFLAHYDAEMRAARPEYAAHKMIMDDVHQRALAAAPKPRT